jgi:hypothetical protein
VSGRQQLPRLRQRAPDHAWHPARQLRGRQGPAAEAAVTLAAAAALLAEAAEAVGAGVEAGPVEAAAVGEEVAVATRSRP